ncbi:hypothetical protein H6P81_013604 [Aristolochia fimbriata]|uniref:Bifunctional inhibitor/plant lipid transfer protein/seed storage helical domain-containing protein n=1 Tax=Aristolochia fimbriata TaxID=158543 RepID=A0AAV7EI12_ARIFI|nr:hypothetical protein H6P81_013604 [Aristolochia fimbriata]
MEKMMKLAAVAMLLTLVIVGEVKLSSADGGFCGMTQEGLLACKPSVSGQNPTSPSNACCNALKGASMSCLCAYKNNNVLPAFGINPKRAMELPVACNLPPPPCQK